MSSIDHDKVQARSAALLNYWFGTMDDNTMLNSQAEPFATHYERWYGKNPQVDAEIKAKFEDDLLAVTGDGRRWDDTVAAWSEVPDGLLALTILLDQIPRNIYRGTHRMYQHDALALLVSDLARARDSGHLPLTRQMFLWLPLMHAENLALQQRMLAGFERLVELAQTRSPANLGFWNYALDYAQRHLAVIRDHGRFPHRNEILGRVSTEAEKEFLKRSDAWF